VSRTGQDEEYMRLALRLAKRGFGSVEPNPMVGCVIVKDGCIIGKGSHKKFGGPHAEINAILDCKKHRADTTSAVMYVTLEPCCHTGKTAPCSEAIITAGIAKVFIAAPDPSEHVAGGGIRRLRKAGIEVDVGLCRDEALLLNAGFFKFARTNRPWVILKWAQSIDGKVALKNPKDDNRWISNELSRKDVHKLRRSVQGIIVGVNTVIADDPLLTARPKGPVELTRIVLDSGLRLPLDCRLLKTPQQPVMIITTRKAVRTKPAKAEKIRRKGAKVLVVKEANRRCDISGVLAELGESGIQRLLVEGGPEVITSFLKGGFADAVVVYVAPKIFGGKASAGISEPMARLRDINALHYVAIKKFGDDVRISGLLKTIDEIR